MGLDMYLKRQVHLANYEYNPAEKLLSEKVLEALGVPNPMQYDCGSLSINLPAGYWRKANMIHQWFVANVQDGIDNCESFYVTREKLEKLRATCKHALEHRDQAENVLPTQTGFFFGGTEYNERYFQELEITIKILDRALDPANAISKYDGFYYESSW